MSGLFDSADVPISYLSFTQEESTDSAVFVVKVPCELGQFLKAESNEDVSVLARENGTADAFVDLHTDPISLDPYAGSNQAFDLKLRTNAVSAPIVSTSVDLKVTSTEADPNIIGGVGAIILPALQISGVGMVRVPVMISGSGVLTLPMLQLSGAGTVRTPATITGTGTLIIP